jgi:hypothetical protein
MRAAAQLGTQIWFLGIGVAAPSYVFFHTLSYWLSLTFDIRKAQAPTIWEGMHDMVFEAPNIFAAAISCDRPLYFLHLVKLERCWTARTE